MTDRNISDKRTFYTIPNPNIHPEKWNLAAQWLHNIGTGPTPASDVWKGSTSSVGH